MFVHAVLMDAGAVVLFAGVMVVARVAMGMAGVGAGLGLERRFDHGRARAEPLQHPLQHVIGRQPQKTIPDLHRDMPVAEMIGGARERLRRIAFDVQQLLDPADHFDDAPVGCSEVAPRSTSPRAVVSAPSSPDASFARRRLFCRSSNGNFSWSLASTLRPEGATSNRDLISNMGSLSRTGSIVVPAAGPLPARKQAARRRRGLRRSQGPRRSAAASRFDSFLADPARLFTATAGAPLEARRARLPSAAST